MSPAQAELEARDEEIERLKALLKGAHRELDHLGSVVDDAAPVAHAAREEIARLVEENARLRSQIDAMTGAMGVASGAELGEKEAAVARLFAEDMRAAFTVPGLELQQREVTVDGKSEMRVIALLEGVFAGTVAVEAGPRLVAGMRQLFVDEGCRERSIGTMLMARACAIASRSGCKALNLLLAKDNREKLGFYERRGFIVAVDYPEGDLCLVKKL